MKKTREEIRALTCKCCGNLMQIINEVTNEYGSVFDLHCDTCFGKRSA